MATVQSSERYKVLDDPATRLPVCLLVDKSYSMNSESARGVRRIDELLVGLGVFVDAILSDIRAQASVELAIVSFGDTIEIERDFFPVNSNLKDFSIQANGSQTRLGAAVRSGLQLLERRKADYSEHGVLYYQPQLVMLTDGQATDTSECHESAQRVQETMNQGKLLSLPFIIGNCDAGCLREFGPGNEIFRVDEADLTSLFQYLSQSAIQLSKSSAGGSESEVIAKILEGLRKNIKSTGDI